MISGFHGPDAKPLGRPIRSLLWAPWGAGEHYHGPGSFAYRLYSRTAPDRVRVTLAHGYTDQAQHSLFDQQHFIAPLVRGSGKSLFRFLRAARDWLCAHHHEFDIMHGLLALQATVKPADDAERLGLPSVLFVGNHKSELADRPGLSTRLRLRRLIDSARQRRAMIRRFTSIVAMSDAIHQELLDYGVNERRIARIPMGVDTVRFRPPESEAERRQSRAELGWPARPTILFVGAICKRKQPHLLVQAVAELRRRGRDCQLALVGPEKFPDYAASVRRLADELRVSHLVIWHGFTQQVEQVFRGADVCALVSQGEGMPASIVEAMASGLPCIASEVSGTSDLLADETCGRLVRPTAPAIADAITAYLDDRNLMERHATAARRKVLERYSSAIVMRMYEEMFQRILSGRDAAVP